VSNQQVAVAKKAIDFTKNMALLDPYIKSDSFNDDIRPYLIQLANSNPQLEAFHFIEFVQKCALTGADPRRNQAYLIPFNKNAKFKDDQSGRWVDNWITVANTIFAYQFFIAKAQEAGDYEGFDVKTVRDRYFNPFNGNEIETLCSLCTVKRKGRDPYTYRAWLPEFVKIKDGMPTDAWGSKPYLMLEKCAIANAFRLTWPEAMSGMYISEEMQGEWSKQTVEDSTRIHARSADVTVVKQETKPAKEPLKPDVIDVTPQPVEQPKEAEEKQLEYVPVQQNTAPVEEKKKAPPVQAAPPVQSTASKRSKALLWSAMQSLAGQNKINLVQAIAKIESANLTEELAVGLIEQIKAGNTSWFDSI